MKNKNKPHHVGTSIAIASFLAGALVLPSTASAGKTRTSPPPSYSYLDGTVGGKAYSVNIDLNALNAVKVAVGPIPQVVLPPKGGFVSEALLKLNVADILGSITLGNVTTGGIGLNKAGSASSSTIEKLNILGLITADLLTSECRSKGNGSTASSNGSSSLVNLKINGNSISVATADNTVINLFDQGLLGGILSGLGTQIGTVTINESIASGDGVNTSGITRNALHIRLNTSLLGLLDIIDGDIIVSSAQCNVGVAMVNTPQPPDDDANGFITGGGKIASGTGIATFGFNARFGHGELQYNDHKTGLKVHGYDVTGFSISGTCATWQGPAKVNGVDGYNFTATACDNDEPGTGNDSFSINVSNGYSNSGTLTGGNIQLH